MALKNDQCSPWLSLSAFPSDGPSSFLRFSSQQQSLADEAVYSVPAAFSKFFSLMRITLFFLQAKENKTHQRVE